MDRFGMESLARFCIAQRNAFDPDAWYAWVDVDREAVAIAGKYLSMTSWYGHEDELDRLVVRMHGVVKNSLDLFCESQAIGFDLLSFSCQVRAGLIQARTAQQHYPPQSGLAR